MDACRESCSQTSSHLLSKRHLLMRRKREVDSAHLRVMRSHLLSKHLRKCLSLAKSFWKIRKGILSWSRSHLSQRVHTCLLDWCKCLQCRLSWDQGFSTWASVAPLVFGKEFMTLSGSFGTGFAQVTLLNLKSTSFAQLHKCRWFWYWLHLGC